LTVIDDLVDLSTIELGQVNVVRERTELRPIVDECVAAAWQLLQGKEARLQVTIQPQIDQVFTDAVKFRRILLYLLSTAADLTEVGEIVLSLTADGSTLVTTVTDTGLDIAVNPIEVMFEEFRQSCDGASGRRSGLGFSLAIVKQLSQLLGASVTVSRVLGGGSTFTLVLPDALDACLGQR
jgi:hypothetical protein